MNSKAGPPGGGRAFRIGHLTNRSLVHRQLRYPRDDKLEDNLMGICNAADFQRIVACCSGSDHKRTANDGICACIGKSVRRKLATVQRPGLALRVSTIVSDNAFHVFVQHPDYHWQSDTVFPIQIVAEISTGVPGIVRWFSPLAFVVVHYVALAWVFVFVTLFAWATLW
jgi:hypothetical protein